MRFLFIAVLAASLSFSAEKSDIAANKLTPVEAAKWKEINDSVRASAEAADRAELAFYRAKEARDKTLADANATLAKMQAEAKCPQCVPVAGPDGSLSWPKPVSEKEKVK